MCIAIRRFRTRQESHYSQLVINRFTSVRHPRYSVVSDSEVSGKLHQFMTENNDLLGLFHLIRTFKVLCGIVGN
jgi:hypothetical protein